MKVPRPDEGVAAVVVVSDGRAEDRERHIVVRWSAPRCAELRQLGYLPTLLEPPWQASFLRRTAKPIVGLSKRPSELQMARGPRRTGAALDSAPAVLSCESLLSLFQEGSRHRSPGPRRRRRTPRGSKGSSTHFAAQSGRCARAERAATPLRHQIARRGRVRKP